MQTMTELEEVQPLTLAATGTALFKCKQLAGLNWFTIPTEIELWEVQPLTTQKQQVTVLNH